MLNRIIMRMSLVFFVFIGISNSLYSQSVGNINGCENSVLNASDVLSAAGIGGHINNGGWTTIPAGITITNSDGSIPDNNASDDIISGFTVGGSPYVVVWTHTNTSNTYSVTINVTNIAPTVTFVADNPTPCGASYNAQVTLGLTGGVANYNVTIERPPEADYSGSFGSGSTGINFGNQTLDRTYTLSSVIDANGCSPANLPIPATFTLSSAPSDVLVTSANVCTPNSLSLTLNSSEVGVDYELRRGAVVVDTWTSSFNGETHTFTLNNGNAEYVAGSSYSVYALSSCATDVDLSTNDGGPFVINATPLPYAISIFESAPYCAGNSFTVQIADTENGYTYELRDPFNNTIGSLVGNGSPRQFPATLMSFDGNYSVVAINGTCTTNMSNTLAIGAIPTIHNITGGSVCEGGSLTVGLASQTAGINYTLQYDDGSSVANLETITSPVTSFMPRTGVGSYTVLATDPGSGCTQNMNGTAYINALPDNSIPFNNTGIVCPSGIVTIGTAGTPAQAAATYYLVHEDEFGVQTDVLSRPGTAAVGGILSFGSQNNEGTYTVRAEIGSCSAVLTTGSLTINAIPSVLNLATNKLEYCTSEPLSGVNLTLGPIESNVTYMLQTETAPGVFTDVVGGDQLGAAGSTLTWANVTANTYRVVARVPGGCEVAMNFQYTIVARPGPTATFTAVSPVRKCESDPTPFSITIDLTGTPPYNFEIHDDKGGVFVVGGHPTNQYIYTPAPVPTATTEYSVENLMDAALCSFVSGTNTGTVTVNPDPSIAFNPTNPITCEGTPIAVSASGAGVGGTYIWSSTGFAATGPTINVAPSADKTYTVTAFTTDGCSSTSNITVRVNPLPILDFDTPGSVYEYCENVTSVVLSVDPAIGGGDFTSTTLGAINAGSNVFNPNAAGVGTHQVTYTYTDGFTCTNYVTKSIVVNALPVVNLTGLSNSYCANAGVVNFNANPNGASAGTTGTFTIVGFNGAGNKGTWWDQDAIAGNGAWLNVGAALASIGARDIEVCYTYSDANSCEQVICQTVTLYPDYNTNLSFTGLPAALCETAPAVTLTPYLAGSTITEPANGTITFSGPGVTDGITTATFDPATAGAGTHTITMDYVDTNGCTGSTTGTITIGTPLNLNSFATEYCSSDAGPYLLEGQINGVTPVQAVTPTWFDVIDPNNNSVALNQPNSTYNFIPSALFTTVGAGTYQVVYKYVDGSGCANTLTTDIEIIEELDATFTIDGDPFISAQSNYCINNGNVALNGSDDLDPVGSGGKAVGAVSTVFTGNGVGGDGITGGNFNPAHGSVNLHPTANTIRHTVIHTVNGKSCPSPIETFDVYVPTVDVSISGITPTNRYCTNGGTTVINVNGTDASNGTAVFSATKGGSSSPFLTNNAGSNTATLDPSVGSGVYEITMVFTKTPATGGCSKTVVETIEVYDDNPVTFSGVSDGQNICIGSSPITVRGDMPSGGVGNFSIIPVIAGGINNVAADDGLGNPVLIDDGVAIIDPSALAIGPYTIRYDYTNAAGCDTYDEKTINIVGAPTNIFTIVSEDKNGNPFSAYCDDDAAATKGVKIGLSGSNTGVTYELLLGGISITPTAVTYTGNGLPFIFDSTGDGTGTDILFTTEGVYTIQAVQNTCDAMMNGSVLVEQYELVLELDSKTEVTCIGADDGIVNLKTTGGSGVYEYAVDGGAWQSSATFAGLTPVPHTFSVRDMSSAGCVKTNTLSVDINEPSVITLTEVNNVDVGCTPCTAGVDCEGSSTITITGGTPDYTTYPVVGYGISWSTGGNALTETLMPVGAHSVTVTDGNGCSQNLAINIGQNAALTLSEDLTPGFHIDNICNSGATGEFVVSAGGGTGNYLFSETDPALGATWVPGNVSGNQYRASSLTAGTYNIWVQDADATYTRCITKIDVAVDITEPLALGIVEQSQTPITCNGATDGEFVVVASGQSGDYQFSEVDPSIAVAGDWNEETDALANTYELTGKGAGTFTVWVRDKNNVGCGYASVNITLADIVVLDFDIIQHKNVSCNLGNDGRLEVLAKGGSGTYVYSWQDGLGNPVAGIEFIDLLEADDYTVTITDALPTSCVPVTHTFTITEPTDLVINLIDNTPADCAAQNTGELTIDVVGGTTDFVTYPGIGYDIDWSTAATATETINGLSPGNYTVNVTDANGCTESDIYTITALSDISLTVPAVIVNNSCNAATEGSIGVTVTGGSGAGNYEFRLEGTQIIDWTNPVVAPFDNITFSNLPAGNYDVKVRDINNTGCEYPLGSYTISEPNALSLISTGNTNITCPAGADGTVSVKAAGGSGTYQFNVNNGVWTGGDLPEDYTAAGLSAGSHTIWVRDSKATGCEYKLLPSQLVTQPDPLDIIVDIIASNNVTCFNAGDGSITVTATGGNGNYDYSKDNGVTWEVGTSATHTFAGLTPGNYNLRVRDHDAVGCGTDLTTHTITQPLDFSTVPTVTDILCNGANTGEIDFNTTYSDASSGAFTYSIDGGTTWLPSPLVNLPAATYVVDIKDNTTGCIKTNAIPLGIKVDEPANPITIGAEWVTEVNCYGESNGSIDLQGTVSGGTAPYNYVWYKKGTPDVIADAGSDVASNLVSGDYYVVIQDNNNCKITSADYTVDQPADWNVAFTSHPLTVTNGADGIIDVHTHTGSNSGHTIKWFSVVAGVETSLSPLYDNVWTVNSFDAGTYRFKITDIKGCVYTSADITLTEPLEFIVKDPNLDKDNVTCNGLSNGKLSIQVVSGKGDFEFDIVGVLESGNPNYIFNSTQTGKTLLRDNLEAGQYTINVTDNATSLVITYIVDINQPNALVVNPISVIDPSCNGAGDGSIEVEITGGVIDVTNSSITWSRSNPLGWSVSGVVDDGITDMRMQSGLFAGEYSVSVVSENGCIATLTPIVLTNPDAITATETVTHVTTNGGTDGRIFVDNIVSTNTVTSITWFKDDGTGTFVATGITGVDNAGITEGIYQYIITDNTGCTYTSPNILVSEPGQALLVTAIASPINCYGSADGVITVNISSGVAPFDVELTGTHDDGSPFVALNTTTTYTEFNALKAGTYHVNVTDGASQTFPINNIVVSENAETILNIVPTDIPCNGGVGSINLLLTGRTDGTESWQILDPLLGEVYNGVLAGNDTKAVGLDGEYIINVTNQDGCILTEKRIVSEPTPFTIDFDTNDATIYNKADGIIDVHTYSGNNGAPYTITWSDDATVSSFLRTDLLAGTYEFTLEDASGCDTTISGIVIGQPYPLTAVVTPKDAVCFGDTNGEIEVAFANPNNGGIEYTITGNLDDGTPAYTSGLITPASVNSKVTGLKAGTYAINATDSKGTLFYLDNIRIEQEAEITLVETVKDISCYGDADGSILIVLNGRLPLSSDMITWSGSKGTFLSGPLYDDGTTSVINNSINPVTTAETFNVVVESAQGCQYQGSYTVNEPNELKISIDDLEDVTCVGGNDGSIDVSVSGRTGGSYRYDWYKWDASLATPAYVIYKANGAASIDDLYEGNYSLTVTSLGDGCTVTTNNIIVLDGSAIAINEVVSNVTTCVGDNSGIITVSVTGGVSPYTIDVTGQSTQNGDGSSAFTFANLVAGNYVIEVSDARGVSCATVTKNVTIDEPTVAFAMSNEAHDISCDPGNTSSGTFTFDLTGGVPSGGNYNYQILLPEASIAKPVTIATGGTHTEAVNNLAAGTYNLTVLDLNSTNPASCAIEYSFTLEHIVVTNDPVVNTTCAGINNGAITGISITGASVNYTYNWTTTDGGIGLDNATLNQSGLSVGTYVLEITDPDRGGCSITKTYTVDVDNIVVITPTIKDVSCNGDSDGAITIDVTGISPATTYMWTGPGIVTNTLEDQVNLSAGNYTVEVTSTIGGQTCIADETFVVSQPNPITYTTSFDYTSCDPYERTLRINGLTGGSGAYTYLWDGPAFTPVVPADPTVIEIYEGGLYSITIKDANKCEVSQSILVPNEVTTSPDVSHVTCNGGDNGSIVLNVAGGSGNFTFAWTGPGGFTSTDRNIDDLYAGPYTVIITDLNENDGTGNCFRSFTITVDEPKPIVIDETIENTSCFGRSDGKIMIEASGGNAPYTYSWSPVVGANLATSRNQINLPADTYTVTVTDASANGGCTAITSIDVLQDAEIILSTVPTETNCDGTGGAIDLTVIGGSGAGFSYNWSSADGTGLVQGVEDQSSLTGGTYTIKVSDLGDDRRSCTASTSVTLTDGIEILNEVITPVSCSGNDDGTISYDVFGGDGNFVYTWNVISGDATRIVAGAQNQSGLSEGVYDVTITDGRTDALGTNCAITHRFTVTASTGLTVNVAVFDSKICFGEPGGRLEATVTGGSGNYSYYWNGALGTNIHNNQVQGIYGLRVVDNVLGCEFTQSYEIKGPTAPLTIDNIVVTDILCRGSSTGAIDVTVSGGVLPGTGDYIYTWTGGTSVATGSNPTGLLAGTYNLTVQDANGCTKASGNIEVTEPTTYIKVDNPQITDVSVPGGSNGQILVDVYDGVAPRSLEWFDAANVSIGTTNPIIGLAAGTYRVVATDANGCSAELTGLRVVEPGEALGFEKTVHQISPCSGDDNGEIHINRVFGGFPIGGDRYRIQITGPGTNVDVENTEYHLTNLAPGIYRVIVTDNVSVSYQEDITIDPVTPLSLVTTKVNDVLCYNTKTGEISVTVNGGKPSALGDYLVEIRSAEGYFSAKADAKAGVPFTFPNLPAGNYTITVKDHADDSDTKVPDRNFCELSNFMLVTQPAAVIDLTSVSGDTEICDGDNYDLSINTSNWDFADGNLRVSVYDDFSTTEHLVNKTPYVITVTPSSSRTYAISKVAKDGNAACLQGETSGNKVQVLVHELPTANITGPSEVCEDGTVTLSVNFTGKAPFSFTWRDENNGTSNTETGITSSTFTFNDSPAGNASYVIDNISDDNSCNNVGNGRVVVNMNSKPIVSLTGGTDICIGDNTNLTISFIKNVAPYTITYEANGVEGTLVVNPAVLTHTWNITPIVTTTYEITSVVDAKGCEMDFTVPIVATVIVNQLPEPLSIIKSTTDTGEVCQGESGVDYSVDPVTHATNYVWSVDAGMNIITGNGTTDIVIDYDRGFTGGYVRVYAENACGVNTTIERWVNATPIPDPIIIAPTGDTDICEGSTGITYSINPVANATAYEWSLPAGFILQGDGTGTSIIVDLDPNIPSTVGEIKVRPVNSCSNIEPWSPVLTVTVTPLPAPFAGADDRICQTAYTLNANPLLGGEVGEWQIIKGAGQFLNKPVDKVRPNAQLYNLSQGENIFVWTVTNVATGCSFSDVVSIFNDQVTVNASAMEDKVCSGSVTLDGTPLLSVDDADEAYWSTTGGGFIVSSTNERTVVNNMDPGVNSFTWTIRKGACYSSASVDVVNNEPSQAVIYDASDVIITMQDLNCQANTTVLKGNVPALGEFGYWRVETGAVTIDNFNNTTINVTNIAKGDHQLSWNIRRGDCLSKTIVTIRNNALNVNAGIDGFSCDGTVQLNGNGEYATDSDVVGVWTIKDNVGAGVFADANDHTTTVTGLSQANGGRNVFVWTLTRNGCESVDSVVIRNDQPTIAEISGGNSTISVCDNEYNLHAVSPVYGNGVWSVVGGRGRFDKPDDPNTRVYDLANGDNIMRWTVTNNSCSSSVEFTITNLHVDVYAGADTAVCGTAAQLHATPAPSGATGVWSVVSGEGSGGFRPSDSNPNASIESLSSGNNKVVWKVTQNSCVSTDTLIVTNNAPMPVSAPPTATTSGSTVTLRAEPPLVGDGVWTLLEGRGDILNPTSSTTDIVNLFPNINRFRWTVTNVNCSDYVDVEVQSGALAQAEAGWDQLDLCEDFTTLQANLPENTFGEWTVDQGGVKFEDDNYNDAKVNIYDVSPGRNVLRWTLRFVGKGSQFTTDTVVIINKKPSDAWAGFDITECGNEAKLEAREPIYGTPTWTVLSGGGAFDDDTDPKTFIRGLNQGENVVKYEITNDICHSYDTISIFNHEPSDALAGDDQIVCADSAEINPSIPKYGIGKWRVIKGSGKGKDIDGNYTDEIVGTYVHALAPGENVLVWDVQVPGAAADCVKSDTITIINNAPSISFAGHDRPICTDSVYLSGSVPIYGTGKWTLISGSGDIDDDLQRNTLVRNLGKGISRFRWTVDNNGCTSVSDVEISNNLIEAFAGYEQVNCADTAVLEANNPSPGEGNWGILGGSGSANFDDNLDPYTNVRKLDKGENILTWTINHKGCRSVSQVKVTNNQPSTAFAGDNKATCDNSIYMGASNPEVGTGHWTIRSGGGKFADDLDNSTLVDSLKFGENIFRWTVEYKGCTSVDDVEINFNTIEATVGGTQEICADKTFLEANSALPGVGTWTVVGGGSQAKFVNSHDPVTEVFDLAKGTNRLMWSINNQGCVTTAEVDIINHMPSTAYAGNTQELCENFTILDATPVSIGTGRWEILTGSAFISATEVLKPKASITGLSKGENVFRWIVTSDNGLCTSEDDVLVINNRPSIPYAGKDEEYCSPTVVLKAAEPDFGTGNWSIIQGGGNFDNPALPDATISNLNEGLNILMWTIKQGQCSLTDSIEITNNTPTTSNAGPDIEDCKNYAPLDANVATQGVGYWTLVSGNATFIDEADPKTRVENLTHGDNILMWNIQKGSCISSDEIVVRNNIPSQAEAGTNKESCEDYVTLNASDPTSGVGSWSVLSGNGKFDDPSSPISIVRDLELGENRLLWTVTYGSCTTEDVVEIISNKAAPYAGEDDVSYESTYELKASNPGDLGATWSIVAGHGQFDDNTFYNTKVNDLNEGVNTFRWKMDVNGCITYDDVSVEYRVVPSAAFKVDTIQGCYPLAIQFTNQSIGGSTYNWDFGDGDVSSQRNPVHTFDDPGVYKVTLTAPGPDGVDGIYQMDIIVHDHPIADFTYGPETVYVPSQKLDCNDASVDAVTYLWDFGDGKTSTLVNPSHLYEKEGVYTITLKVESEYNCVDEITKVDIVTVKLEGFIEFPNAFEPRPDGGNSGSAGGLEDNSIFKPIKRDVETYKLQIFNRWGQLIYESEDIEEGWNGFFNNQLSPQGVYVWKATGTFISGTVFNEAGSVLLVR